MIAELFPFWVNYWHYLSLVIVVFVWFNLTYKSAKKSSPTKQNELATEIIQGNLIFILVRLLIIENLYKYKERILHTFFIVLFFLFFF